MSERIVYVIQEIPGTKVGNPKINIMGAAKFGKFKFLLPEDSQIIFSPGPLIYRLRPLLKDFNSFDKYHYQFFPFSSKWRFFQSVSFIF